MTCAGTSVFQHVLNSITWVLLNRGRTTTLLDIMKFMLGGMNGTALSGLSQFGKTFAMRFGFSWAWNWCSSQEVQVVLRIHRPHHCPRACLLRPLHARLALLLPPSGRRPHSKSRPRPTDRPPPPAPNAISRVVDGGATCADACLRRVPQKRRLVEPSAASRACAEPRVKPWARSGHGSLSPSLPPSLPPSLSCLQCGKVSI